MVVLTPIEVNATVVNATGGLMREVFQSTEFLGYDWLIGAVLTMITLVLVTRTFNDWKVLAFPIMLGWHTVGVTTSPILLIALGLVYIIDSLSFSVIGNVLQVGVDFVREGADFAKDQYSARKTRIAAENKFYADKASETIQKHTSARATERAKDYPLLLPDKSKKGQYFVSEPDVDKRIRKSVGKYEKSKSPISKHTEFGHGVREEDRKKKKIKRFFERYY